MAAGLSCRLSLSNATSLNFLKSSSSICFCKRTFATERNNQITDEDTPEESRMHKIAYSINNIVPESKKFYQEQKQVITSSPMIDAQHGHYETIFRFDSKEAIDNWIVTSDKDNKGGNSTADFLLSQNKTGLFRGNLSHVVPKDGITKYAGYANITQKTPMKSFRRETHWDWSLFNCLLMKVRGDGRTYTIVLGTHCDFDVSVLNRWTYYLYTRGGPYWQTAKIPFSKFYVSYKGRIQDRQHYLPLNIINSFGITVADSGDGPFCLEIDSIAVMNDINMSGKHAYELYSDRNLEAQ